MYGWCAGVGRTGPVAAERALSLHELRRLRLRAQGLAPRLPRRALLRAVQQVVGVNAQLVSAMALSLRARVAGLTWPSLEAARVERRALVRTWCMRGTLHLMAAADLDGLISAVPPGAVRGAWRWLERRASLKGDRARLVLDTTYQVLKREGPLARRALMAAVSAEVGFETQAAAAGAVFLNGLLGRVCFGPMPGAEPTYAALDDWLGRPLALAGPDHSDLARRYLRGYGPATPRDLAAWWGMGLAEARAAWAALGDELIELCVDGQPVWQLASGGPALDEAEPPGSTVCLLPAFDTYLLGYADRDFAVPRPYQARIFHGGQVVPTLLVDGAAAGTWRYEQRGRQMRVAVAPFAALSRAVREGIEAEAQDIGRFYGVPAAVTFSAPGK